MARVKGRKARKQKGYKQALRALTIAGIGHNPQTGDKKPFGITLSPQQSDLQAGYKIGPHERASR